MAKKNAAAGPKPVEERNFIYRAFWSFTHGDIWVKLSALIAGMSCFKRKQYLKGALQTAAEAVILYLIFGVFAPYMSKLDTLGTVQYERVMDRATRSYTVNNYDNSFMILLFGLIGVVLCLAAVILWLRNLNNAYEVQVREEKHRHINSFREDLTDCMNVKYHRTILTLPVLGVVCFTIIPLLVMILVAFTNYDKQHLVPANLFTWVGLTNFKALLNLGNNGAFGYAFIKVLIWTLEWAVLATFTTYFGGILLAMFINNKNTHGKKLWRSLFMVAIAVPQFVSLLLVRSLFADQGIVNTLCSKFIVSSYQLNVPVADILSQTYIDQAAGVIQNFVQNGVALNGIVRLPAGWEALVTQEAAELGQTLNVTVQVSLTNWLKDIGMISTNYIPFLTNPTWAKAMVVLINMWVGIPYQMLIAYGVLMNIPVDLLEAAKIDGANAWQSFRSITMPYVLFVTGPSLVNQLVSNINNFNVIYLLTQDIYTTQDQTLATANAMEPDLLVTWLYRLTQEQSNYKMASVIGILVFIVCAIITLIAFNQMIKGDKEDSFQ